MTGRRELVRNLGRAGWELLNVAALTYAATLVWREICKGYLYLAIRKNRAPRLRRARVSGRRA